MACGSVVLSDVERGEQTVQVLHVGNVTAKADYRGASEDAQTLDVGKASEGAVGCCKRECGVSKEGPRSMSWLELFSSPKLSAAMTTPSLNFTPRTDVPVTAGL